MNSKERRRLKRKAAGTDQGKATNNNGGATQWSRTITLPTVRFWGWAAAEEYANTLADLLGPDCGVHTAETFCQSNGCSAEEMQAVLNRDWALLNIQKVERSEENAGVLPLILIEGTGNICSLSLYSPTDEVRKQCYSNMPNTNGLSYDELADLSRILGGPDQVFLVEEQEFCETVQCEPDQVEEHLRDQWVEHDIQAVLAGREFVPQPTVVLVCYRNWLVTWRLITQRDAGARQQCLEINELSRLYRSDSEKAERDPSS
jgi:hypothetical protein